MITVFLIENHPWCLLHVLMPAPGHFARLGEWAWVGRVLDSNQPT